MAAPVLLDISASFGVIDHVMLIKCIEFSICVEEKTLYWMKSYYFGRTYCISVSDRPLVDILQGSVLGLKNYCTYIKPVRSSTP